MPGMDKTPRAFIAAIRLAAQNEPAAVAFIEAQRWGSEPACPHCGDVDVYAMQDRKTGQREKNFRWRCRGCGKMFSVRTGTVYEESRLPLRHWVHAFWRASASKKGVSALQIARECGITHKSALFLMHRIRLAMALPPDAPKLSGVVEADETYIGGKRRRPHGMPKSKRQLAEGDVKRAKRWGSHGQDKQKVLAMVERGGKARLIHADWITAKRVKAHLQKRVTADSVLMTDEAPHYKQAGKTFARHESVNHSQGEYVRGDVTTNTVEGVFSLLKRGLYGTFHVVSAHHLHRYLAEFEFRHNHRHIDDGARTIEAIRGADGKRLMYKPPASAA